MTEALDHLLEGGGLHLDELRGLLRELLGPCGEPVRLVRQSRLKRLGHVYGVQFETSGGMKRYVLKRLQPAVARRDQFVATRWLPAAGLGEYGPPLVGTVAERSGQWTWHVYEDLGSSSLAGIDREHEVRNGGEAREALPPLDGIHQRWLRSLPGTKPDRTQVHAAMELIAEVHGRFAGHALLGECRFEGGNLGTHFFVSDVQDAICALESLAAPAVVLTRERAAMRDRLLAHMRKLLSEEWYRVRQMKESGGPETLLHGDFRPHNVLFPQDGGSHLRLIDWDHASVGLAAYDLSTFLLCLPVEDRLYALGCYQKATEHFGWTLPPRKELNLLFNTAESARLANYLIWPAIAVFESQPEWAFEDLAKCERWLDGLEEVLPL